MFDPGAIELWGGVECTVNRVGSHYFDQQRFHSATLWNELAEQCQAMGIRALRFPVLWERHASPSSGSDLAATQKLIDIFRRAGVEPIVGLLHHGSGPPDTSLIDPQFPERFAAYAKRVAIALPEVKWFTPINEPLTTARFSGLYGFWYPHGQNDAMFLDCLVNQLRGSQLAMQSIQSVSPDARWLQTENLEKTHAVLGLEYQADFENERRWLSTDLLTGRFKADSALWTYVHSHVTLRQTLSSLMDSEIRPFALGWNYYLTSERFLDNDWSKYPHATVGGNGYERYVDIEAVRAAKEGMDGLEQLVRAACQRFDYPTAITEIHLGCHRESQLRWFVDAWDTGHQLRQGGYDVRAVTTWNMLGCYDWDSLCTVERKHYESGAFDTRSGSLRPTALAHALAEIGHRREFDHHALQSSGWWQQPKRLYDWESNRRTVDDEDLKVEVDRHDLVARPPLLIAGAAGTLGKAFMKIAEERGLPVIGLDRFALDVTDMEDIVMAIERYRPWAIVNAAGYVRIDQAELEPKRCMHINAYAATQLAKAAQIYDLPLLLFSTDMVFNGRTTTPYREHDTVDPINVYGVSKSQAESTALHHQPKTLLVRTSSFFGLWDEANFLTHHLDALRSENSVQVSSDLVISPTYVPDLVHACLDLLIDRASGIWHLTNGGSLSWYELLCLACEATRCPRERVQACSVSQLGYRAARPRYSALASQHGAMLPALSEAIEKYAVFFSAARDWKDCPVPS